MDMQFGFDFEIDFARSFAEHAPGTWNRPMIELEQFRAVLDNADAPVARIAGPARALFRLAIDAAKVQLATDEWTLRTGKVQFHDVQVDVPDDHIGLFIAHCVGMQGSDFYGIQYKVRQGLDVIAGMYLDKVGTLVAYKWKGGQTRLAFQPFRATLFLDSYADHRPVIELPYAIWHKSYCADKLCNAQTKLANVQPFMYQGRKYVVTGGSSHHNVAVYDGWRLCALADWKGPTYTYASHGVAANEGKVERGDHRGLIVLVRGQKYVMESGAVFHDQNVDFRKAWEQDPEKDESGDED